MIERDPTTDEEFTRLGEEQLRRRGRVILMSLLYSTAGLIFAGLTIVALYKGYIPLLLIGFVCGLLFFHQAWHYLRDISARPITHEGEVRRKWHKGNLFFVLLPAYYIMVERKVFSVSRTEYAGLLEEDLVRIKCYPHSLTVEQLERYDTTRKEFVPATRGAVP